MSRLTPIDPAAAQGRAKDLLEGIEKALGRVPNLIRTLAHSPAALEAYLGVMKALGRARIGATLREQIALAVSNANRCAYCVAAHTAVGGKLGLDAAELAANLESRSGDAQVAAALRFAHAIVETRGWVRDGDLAEVRAAGYGEDEIVEIVATVAHTTFSNYFDHVAGTEIDFPPVALVESAAPAAA